MSKPRWLKVLHSLALEFWLPLPILGIAFWMGSGWMSDRVFSQDYQTTEQLQVNTEGAVELFLKVTVISIEAEVHRSENFTEVQVNTANSALTELRFEFPVTEFNLIEAAISQELGLSVDSVRRLVRYRIDE